MQVRAGALREVGAEALGALAYEEARHWFELALRCKPAAERDLQRARLYVGLSCCQPARAVFHYGREAFELFMELGATDEAIRVAARPAALIWGDRGAWQEHIVEQALALSPPGAQLGWLHARRGETAWFVRGDRETAERSLADAIEIGRAEGDLDLQVHALRDLRLPGLSGSPPLHDLRRKIDHPVYQMELEHADIWGALRDGEDQRVLNAAPRAMELCRRLRDHTAYMTMSSLGRCYAEHGDWSMASAAAVEMQTMGYVPHAGRYWRTWMRNAPRRRALPCGSAAPLKTRP